MTDKNALLRKLLHDEEGKKLTAYKDSEGYWTIGYGHLLDCEQAEDELAVLGLNDELDNWDGFTITEQQASDLFDIDVNDAIETMPADFDEDFLQYIGEHRRAALISMAFQQGTLNKFKSMLKAIRESDWDRAADEMLWSNGLTKKKRSLWYNQTPARCQRASDAIRTGYFEKYMDNNVATKNLDNDTNIEILQQFKTSDLLNELLRRSES